MVHCDYHSDTLLCVQKLIASAACGRGREEGLAKGRPDGFCEAEGLWLRHLRPHTAIRLSVQEMSILKQCKPVWRHTEWVLQGSGASAACGRGRQEGLAKGRAESECEGARL